jgi:hypothetical protein
MLELLIVVVRALTLAVRGHRELVLENLALRQQLAAFHRTTRCRLRARDRLFWMVLARSWRNWRTALIVVQPDTVIRWHRDWLRRRWTRRSKQPHHGRPPIDQQIRTLVREMATANPLWGAPRIHGELRTLGVEVTDRDRRAVAQIPAATIFQEKWRQALTLIRRARAAGLHITAVLADAEFGDVTAFRRALHRWRLPYAVGISCHLTVFPGTPAVHVPPSGRRGRPRSQLVLVHDTRPIAVRALALGLPRRAWRRVTWRNGTNRPWAARFAAVRVTPANDWRERRLAPEVWLLCEQDLGATPRTKYFFVDLPASASMKQLVRLAHQRWAIEQQYQELKTELGFDHFEGRSYPGWQHHVVLTAVAYAFLQRERQRRGADESLTFPGIRAIVQEIFTALLLAQQPDYFKRIEELRQINLRI